MKKKEPSKFQSLKTVRFPGGNKALLEFIQKNINYPPLAIQNKVEGTVQIKCEINENGKVLKTVVVHGLGYGLDEEALRICKLLSFERAVNKGVKVIFFKTVNVYFKLPPPSTVEQPLQIVYHYVSSSPKN